MSANNKHDYHAKSYMTNYLGGWMSCPKKNCPGRLIPVFVQYKNNNRDKRKKSSSFGEVEEELECSVCEKIVKGENVIERIKQGENILTETFRLQRPERVYRSWDRKQRRRRNKIRQKQQQQAKRKRDSKK